MKTCLRRGLGLAFLLSMLLLGSLQVQAASYKWDFNKDTLQLRLVNTKTGRYVKNRFKEYKGYTYYFDKNGYVCTGWTEIGKYTYYFDSSGAMVTETWVNNRYLVKNGRMARSRWVTDSDGIRSYVGKDGVRIDNYKKNVKVGLKKTKKGYRFRQADGSYASAQWVRWKGAWYYFYDNTYMATQAFIGNHYVGRNGKMVTSRWVTIGKKKYKFDRDGEIIKTVSVKKTSSKSGKKS